STIPQDAAHRLRVLEGCRSEVDDAVRKVAQAAPRPVVPQPARHAADDLLQLWVVHRANAVADRCDAVGEWSDRRAPFVDVAEIRNRHGGTAVPGDRGSEDLSEADELVRSFGRELSEGREDLMCVFEAVHQQAAEQETNGMQPERELDDDAEVPAATSQRPEQIGVLLFRRADDSAVGSY